MLVILGNTKNVVPRASSTYTIAAGQILNPFVIQGASHLVTNGFAITPSHNRSRIMAETNEVIRIIRVFIE